jgi:hypothetical protein
MLKLVVVSGPEIFEKLVIVGDTFAINNHLSRKKVLDLYKIWYIFIKSTID